LAFFADVEYVPCGQSLPVEIRKGRKGQRRKRQRRKRTKDKGGKGKGGTNHISIN
jgi:hypothetical protein